MGTGRRRLTVAGLPLAAALFACPAQGQWSVAVDAGLEADSNVGNARSTADRVRDYARSLSLGANDFMALEDGNSLNWGTRLEGVSYSNLHGLDSIALESYAAFRHKLVLGAYAPWLQAAWSSAHLAYQDRSRNGWLHRADLSAGMRMDERRAVSATLRLEYRHARPLPEEDAGVSSDVFSQRAATLLLRGDHTPSPDTDWTLSALLRRGDVVSTALSESSEPSGIKAVAEDRAFGDDAYAYRLLATTYGVGFSVAKSFSRTSAVNVGVQRLESRAGGGFTYGRTIAALHWIWSF